MHAELPQVAALLSKPQEVEVGSSTGGLSQAWFNAFRVHQAHEVRDGALAGSTSAWHPCREQVPALPRLRFTHGSCLALQIWQQHGAWVTEHRPNFGPGIRERFQMAEGVSRKQYEEAAQQRGAARQRLAELLGGDGVLMLPTAPAPAPLLNTPSDQLDAFRTSLISLTCIAGLSGFPQVGSSLPASSAVHDGVPPGA